MSRTAALLLVIAIAVLAMLLAGAARRAIRLELRRLHHEVGSAMFAQLGLIFAVLLAFVFNEVWSEYNTAAQAIGLECSSLYEAATLAGALPSEFRDPAKSAIQTYVRSVIDEEWPSMRGGAESPRAAAHMRALLKTIAQMDPPGAAASATRASMLAVAEAANQHRHTRLFQMTLSVPRLVWDLLILMAAVLIVFVLLSGTETLVTQLFFAGVFTALVCFLLVIVQWLDHPFTGALRLPPADFIATLGKISAAD